MRGQSAAAAAAEGGDGRPKKDLLDKPTAFTKTKTLIN
jgi:hypothetical protein